MNSTENGIEPGNDCRGHTENKKLDTWKEQKPIQVNTVEVSLIEDIHIINFSLG